MHPDLLSFKKAYRKIALSVSLYTFKVVSLKTFQEIVRGCR